MLPKIYLLTFHQGRIAMNEKQNDRRWFLIKHECGAIFTIDSQTLPKSFDVDREPYRIICQNCGKILITGIPLENFIRQLRDYDNLCNKLNGAVLREVQPKDLNYESLPQYLLNV